MNFLLSIASFLINIRSFFSRKVFFTINSKELVLDVGSGDKPFWRADVIVDKDLIDDKQRASGGILTDSKRIFIEADVEKLPFKDKVFDFVFCSHLLEHVEHPDKAIKELVRVAKRGYIEVPNAIGDLLSPFSAHLWLCDYQNKVLTFYQKTTNETYNERIFKQFGNHISKDSAYRYLMSKHSKDYFICILWVKNVKFNVIKNRNAYRYKYDFNDKTVKPVAARRVYGMYKIFYQFMTLLFYKKKNIDLKKLLKHE